MESNVKYNVILIYFYNFGWIVGLFLCIIIASSCKRIQQLLTETKGKKKSSNMQSNGV